MQGEPRDTAVGEQRRLAAIVFTDVVSYSARMQRDESGTLALVRTDFETMRARCSAHKGEVLNTMGDGMLMCFSSAVEAVSCALELQKMFGMRAEAEPPEKALLHRIGIHVGDVFFQDGNVSGDGVNIAARLESKAPHGGICASQIVHDTVKGKLEMWSVFLGEQKFKNIEQPIAVYTIAPPGMGIDTRPPTVAVKEVESGLRWRLAAVVLVLIAGGFFAIWHKTSASGPAKPAVKTASPTPEPEKPAVPVTPGQRLAAQAQALARKPSFTREELALAGDLALKASELEPDSAFAWGTRAEVSASYIYRGWDADRTRARDAETWARRAMALDAKEPGASFALGVIARVQGVYDNAERLLRQAIEVSPDYGRFRLELAQVFTDQGKPEQARAIIQEAIKRNPRDLLAHYNLAMTYANYMSGGGASADNRVNAIRELDAVLAIAPMANAVLLKAAIAGSWGGDVKRMRELLDTLKPEERSDDRAVYWSIRCGLLERNPEHIMSATALTAQDYIDDVQSPKAWFVAHAHLLAGHEELARAQWEAAAAVMRRRLQRNPDNLRDQISLLTSLAWQGQGRDEEVTRELARLEATLRPQASPSQAHWLARVYAGRGDAAHAVPYIRRALNQMIFVTDATLPMDPWWDRLRGQPEFEALLKEVGAPASASSAAASQPGARAAPDSEGRRMAEQAQTLCRKIAAKHADFDLAAELAGKASELEPGLALAWGVRAEVAATHYYAYRESTLTNPALLGDAEIWARRALALDPNEPGALYALGIVSHMQGNHAEAERLLRQVADASPADNRARLALAEVLYDRGRVDQARASIQEAIARNPRDLIAHYNLALTYVRYFNDGGAKAENRVAAIRALDETLALGPLTDALLLKATILGTWDGDLKGMREVLDQLQPAQKSDERAIVVALWAAAFERNPQRIRTAASLTAQDFVGNVSFPKAWFVALACNLEGNAAAAQTQWQAAEAAMRERLRRDPGNPHHHLMLAVTLAWLGRDDEVAREMEPLLQRPMTPVWAFWMARVYGGQGDAGRTATYLRQSVNKLSLCTNTTLAVDPWWDKLRDQPEFKALLAELSDAPAVVRPSTATSSASPGPPVPAAPKPAALPDAKSIAVLPFANLSADPANAFFADGVHEDVITNLAKIHDLKVISRTSVMGYRDSKKSVKEIASELGVSKVLEGSVRRAGEHARITAQLIDARTDEHVWAETYDRDLNDVFAVQSEIARKIAATLQAQLTSAERQLIETRPTSNQKAYDLYVKARDAGPFRDWITLLAQAVAEDPNFALAQAELSRAYAHSYWSTQASDQTPEALVRSKAALDIAMKLAPDLPEIHFAIGDFHYRSARDWETAWKEFKLAEAGIPNHSPLMQQMAYTARRRGSWDEALDYFERARRLDPMERGARFTYPLETLIVLRRFSQARHLAAESVSAFGDFPWFHWTRILLQYELDGDRAAFEQNLAKLPGGKMSEIMSGTLVRERLRQAIRFGDRNAIEAMLADPSLKFINSEQGIVTDPIALYRAEMAFIDGRMDDAAREAEAAIAYYKNGQWKPRQEVWVLLGIARAEAYAGRADDAMRDATQVLVRSAKEDAWDTVYLRPEVGRIYAALGHRDEAIGLLHEMVAGASGMTPRQVRDDPLWSRLKDDPRFEELLQQAKPL